MNVDTVETVSSQTASTDLDFASVVRNWNAYGEKCWGVNSKNQITINHDGDYLLSGLLSNESYPEPGTSADVSIKFNQSNAGVMHNGLCFNITQDPKRPWIVSGYFMSLSCHNQSGNTSINQRVLWKIENWDFLGKWSPYAQNTTECCAYLRDGFEIWRVPGATKSYYYATDNITTKITCLASWVNDGTNIDYSVRANDGRITVDTTQGGKTIRVADVKDGTYQGGTYGFYGTNCEQTQPFAISNLTYSYSQTVAKSFGDIVYEPKWTDGALHMLINIDTKPDGTMLGSDGGTEISRQGGLSPARPAIAPRRRPSRHLQAATLAADAAGILERDYGIDAGEVLSMNVDTVETSESKSEVDASDADTILGNPSKGIAPTWGSYTFAHNGDYGGGGEAFNQGVTPPTASSAISNAWEIRSRDVKSLVTDDAGNQSVQTAEESVVLFNKGNWAFEFLRNDAEWQDPEEYTEATYRTTIGGDTNLQGTENLNACGEAWWFFKLSEDNKEGYAICYDNHGHDGCGLFTRYWFQMYLVHYDWNNPTKAADYQIDPNNDNNNTESLMNRGNGDRNAKILKKWRVSPLQVCPRYDITVHEKDGKATITVDPDELNAPYSYIGGEEWARYNQYYTGYNKETGELNTSDVFASYRAKDSYNWEWPGATQGPVSATIDLSDSIRKVKTTQAFSAFAWNGTYFANNSVDTTKTIVKSFGDIVYEPNWTDGALHMLINIDTKPDKLLKPLKSTKGHNQSTLCIQWGNHEDLQHRVLYSGHSR